jgi:ferredoxin
MRERKNMAIKIEKNLCPENHRCPAVRVCPVDALIQEGVLAPVVDADKCIDCGDCAQTCPTGALIMEG